MKDWVAKPGVGLAIGVGVNLGVDCGPNPGVGVGVVRGGVACGPGWRSSRSGVGVGLETGVPCCRGFCGDSIRSISAALADGIRSGRLNNDLAAALGLAGVGVGLAEGVTSWSALIPLISHVSPPSVLLTTMP